MMVSEKQKNKEWCGEVLDAIVGYMGISEGHYDNSRTKDIRNYQANRHNYSGQDTSQGKMNESQPSRK